MPLNFKGAYFQDSASLDAAKLTVYDNIIYYIVIMSVLLFGFLVLLSTKNSSFYKKLLSLENCKDIL